MMEQLCGKRLGKYRVIEELGRGAMGAVFNGHDATLERTVAIKVLAPHLTWEPNFVERFLREARVAARLKHPNIVTIYDVGQEGGWYYFVMELDSGEKRKWVT
ncbi:MAG: serine/threonine protein kinase [Chloroflexia bacterium]